MQNKKRSAVVAGIAALVLIVAVIVLPIVFKPSVYQPTDQPVVQAPAEAPTKTEDVPKLEPTPMSLDDPYYVLLLGSDSRSSDLSGSRTDAIMLIRVDEKTPSLTLVSLPRDTLAEIEGYGSDKINAAYAYGGLELAEKAVEQRLGVEIRYHALLGFDTTTNLVDHLGGVTIDVDANMGYKGVYVEQGLQTLDGVHALTFARCRKELARGDWHRVEHHRDLFIATFEKITQAQASDYPALAAEILPYLETNMSADKAVQLLKIFKDFDTSQIYEATTPATSGMQNGGYYIFLSEDEWAAMRERIEQGLPPE